jgi:tRNA-binding protein
MTDQINYSDFSKIDIRVGTVIEVTKFPEAHKPSWKLKIDFGALGILKSSAQITDLYSVQDLLGRQVLAVVNFPDKQIGPFRSQCLVLGSIGDADGVVLIGPERQVKNGSRIA